MADEWVLLVPAGVEVTQTASTAVDEPTLLTRREVIALADAAAALTKAGIEVNVGALLRSRKRDDYADDVHYGRLAIADDQVAEILHPPIRRDPEFPCVCSKFYSSEAKLKEHQRTCAMHNNGLLIPKAHQVES